MPRRPQCPLRTRSPLRRRPRQRARRAWRCRVAQSRGVAAADRRPRLSRERRGARHGRAEPHRPRTWWSATRPMPRRHYCAAALRQWKGRREQRDRPSDRGTCEPGRCLGDEPDAEDDSDRREGAECVRVAERLCEERSLERVERACLGQVARERINDDSGGDHPQRGSSEQQVRLWLRAARARPEPARRPRRRWFGATEHGLGGAGTEPQPRERPTQASITPADPSHAQAVRERRRSRDTTTAVAPAQGRERAGPHPGRRVEAALVEGERDDERRRHEQQRMQASNDVHRSSSCASYRTKGTSIFVERL